MPDEVIQGSGHKGHDVPQKPSLTHLGLEVTEINEQTEDECNNVRKLAMYHRGRRPRGKKSGEAEDGGRRSRKAGRKRKRNAKRKRKAKRMRKENRKGSEGTGAGSGKRFKGWTRAGDTMRQTLRSKALLLERDEEQTERDW